jgi:hypothetical protein
MSLRPRPVRDLRPVLLLLPVVLPGLLLTACQDYTIEAKGDANGQGDDGGEGGGDGGDGAVDPPADCEPSAFPAEEIGVDDLCTAEPPGGFDPIVEWEYGSGQGCLSQPVVGDLDSDGVPEIVFNLLATFFNPPGQLVVLKGDGSGVLWRDDAARLGFGSPPALGDIDGDGFPNVVVVREYASSLLAVGDYTAVAYDHTGRRLWESAHFEGRDFDYATAPNIRDMDHDGAPEIVLGRVILNGADGSTRGVGAYGRGSYGLTEFGGIVIGESSVPAVTDIDLDGVDEVIVGDAMYGPDGEALWFDLGQEDAMIAVANLDDDPEGEWVGITGNTVRAHDTDGRVLWGPTEIAGANILAPAGIADLDGDGSPEIVTAGGNQLVVYRADGGVFWSAAVQDESGATGASFFDFEGDGLLEVVYIDEIDMVVFDGRTGARKFVNGDHGSNTMFDYPTVADVDADGQAEIVVCHNSFGSAISVYGDASESWRPARAVWNQHAYDITNINDDLSVPTDPVPGFADHNTWHSAQPSDLGAIGEDLSGEILAVCQDECADGTVYVTFRAANIAGEDLAEDIDLTLYAVIDGAQSAVEGAVVSGGLASGWASEAVVVAVPADAVRDAESLLLRVDDDGTGTGLYAECSETNNLYTWAGPFCAD